MSARFAVLAAILLLLPVSAFADDARAPSAAPAQADAEGDEGEEDEDTREDRVLPPAARAGARIGLAFQGGFLGKMHLSSDAEDPGKFQFSPGFLARIDTPVARYLVAGGEAGFIRARTDNRDAQGDGRGTYADIGSVWKLRYPWPLKSGKYLEPYVMIPLGITMFAPSTQWTAMKGGAGFYTGAFLGLSYFLGARTILHGELGWQHRFTWQEYAGARSSANGGQLFFRVGFALRL